MDDLFEDLEPQVSSPDTDPAADRRYSDAGGEAMRDETVTRQLRGRYWTPLPMPVIVTVPF